ncbi:rRNA small subunit methyltransferase B [Mycetocola tolaasinivorans]|uniref:rRNA small subunit methyltransferase B n=1 Tax=Mycetocola tolaasinivorans TaxID=76635 RepID=A0A3L7A9M5_9MICO|nr:transcription antitermination factor NusB [Mycetocola tolaasinivorans]RLP77039.1 rRNA small subunit methyltransferase B [Mycetocola tolaasinivorans]
MSEYDGRPGGTPEGRGPERRGPRGNGPARRGPGSGSPERSGNGSGDRRGSAGERSGNGERRAPRGGGQRRPGHAPSRDDRAGDAVQPARRVAYDVIVAVRADDAYANLLLPTAIRRAALSSADAGLATELCYGSLRLRGYYDRVIELAANRAADQIDPEILDVLRLGVHQILGTRVAAHAAVNESVSLAREVGSRSSTGFVNGVLRAITRAEPEEWRERVAASAKTEDERLSLLHSHPEWIVRSLRQSLRAEGRGDELEAALAADNEAPKVTYIALPERAERPAVAEASAYSPLAFTLGGGDPEAVIRAASGLIRVQDEGSQLAALALSRARAIEPGEAWSDLCAGPGGKAVLLAAEALNSGATLLANEVVPARAELVRRALAVLPEEVEVSRSDARDWGERHPQAFTRTLVDAPCTGLGALRRRPEARWRKTPKDLAELGVIQLDLVHSAVAGTAPGGLLAYVTCSPHIAETRGVVTEILRRHPHVTLLDTQAILAEITESPLDLGEGLIVGEGSTVQLWPHRHGTDAMFIALLRVGERAS